MANLIWSIVLGGLGIWGIYLAGKKNIYGWVLGFFAQFLWFTFGIISAQYGFILSAIAYGTVYALNYIRWRKEKLAHTQEEAS